jgi:hypothetical protein
MAAIAAMVLRPGSVSPELLVEAVRRRLDLAPASVRSGAEDVQAWLPYSTVDRWYATVSNCHAGLTEEVGVLTVGHALCRRGAGTRCVEYALIQAAEAALVSERLFGPGHLTSYADALLARFLLGQQGAADLRALYERAVGKLAGEDLRQDSQLVNTLEAYCESFVTRRTAERLGVHRNTVLYRLKRIEEITSADLEDGPTRLLLQIGLLAGRILRRQRHVPQVVPAPEALQVAV